MCGLPVSTLTPVRYRTIDLVLPSHKCSDCLGLI